MSRRRGAREWEAALALRREKSLEPPDASLLEDWLNRFAPDSPLRAISTREGFEEMVTRGLERARKEAGRKQRRDAAATLNSNTDPIEELGVRLRSIRAALGLDARLPTGDEDNLLGVGGTQARLALIFSHDYGKLSPRASLGYTVSSGKLSENVNFEVPSTVEGQNVLAGQPVPSASLDVPDELNDSAGLDLRLPTGDEDNLLGVGVPHATTIFSFFDVHARAGGLG